VNNVPTQKIVIIGAGIGGLTAALRLAQTGCDVVVCEKAATPGGKLREVAPDGVPMDAGPTVFTMRPVFEAIFAAAGTSLAAHLTLRPLEILARHSWQDGGRLDLHADSECNIDAIGQFAGTKAVRGYLAFTQRAASVFNTLDHAFMQHPAPSLVSLTCAAGLSGLGDLWRISPYTTLWDALGQYFPDPRLRQLFARYATYCGASPFEAPATLMLIAHVEQCGVWRIEGGMHRLAVALADLAQFKGARFRYQTNVTEILVKHGRAAGVRLAHGETIEAGAVICNAEAAALPRFGAEAAKAAPPPAPRSLSALTFALSGAMTAETSGLPLDHHNVFFSRDYQTEFRDIAESRLPRDPTIYICDQGENRLFCLINAPPNGDTAPLSSAETETCWNIMRARLTQHGLMIQPEPKTVTGPAEFDRLFPATGGALYGRALRSWRDPFARPTSKTRLPGLYLAGGSIHPGPGLPMAALSGQFAATQALAALASQAKSRKVAMPGGILTRSAMTSSTR
jgi:1-hydroxycarotenoid 3,4-desaturase